MRPARTVIAVVFAAAVAVTGCAANSAADRTPSAPQAPATAPPGNPAPAADPTTASRPAGAPSTAAATGHQDVPGRCAASALRGSFLGTEGAAGTIWTSVRLRNVSSDTCTVQGAPDVRLLGSLGEPVLPPSRPDLPDGSLVTLRPGAAAQLAFAASNVCERRVSGNRIRVTLADAQGSLEVRLGEPGLATCRILRVRPLALAIG